MELQKNKARSKYIYTNFISLPGKPNCSTNNNKYKITQLEDQKIGFYPGKCQTEVTTAVTTDKQTHTCSQYYS